MKKIISIFILFSIIFLFSCKKELILNETENEYNKAFNQLSAIVKGKGEIFNISMDSFFQNNAVYVEQN